MLGVRIVKLKKRKMEENRLETEISPHNCLNQFRKPLLQKIINTIEFPVGSFGLDAGCGIGFITNLLAETVEDEGQVIGLDFSQDYIQYAKKKYPNIKFKEGDINNLPFSDNTFDWLWSADTVWAGPTELGCPSDNPLPIINEYRRVVKPGGFIILLFWSSQKLLSGYPLLEARLNTTSSATAPFKANMDPLFHILNCKHWYIKAGLNDVSAETYLYDINAPLSEEVKKALLILFDMLWGESKSEISKNDWRDYSILTNTSSDNFILNNPQYYGYYTYTVFNGKVK